MKLLLDTQVLIWLLGEPERLSPGLVDLLEDTANPLLASTASVMEVAIKSAKRKLEVPDDWPDQVAGLGCSFLPVSARHAWRVRSLLLLHKDPFDRLLVAQALEEEAVLVTRDADLLAYPVSTIAA